MKLKIGKSPEDDFFKREDGWVPLKEPKASVSQLVSLPIGIALAILVYLLAVCITRFEGFEPKLASIRIYSYQVLLAVVIIVPVHEIIHAALFPGGLVSGRTMVGFWPQMLAFYAHYNGEMSRNRFITVFLAPFAVISILPVLIMSLAGYYSVFAVIVCLVNAFAACVDILGALLFITGIPKNAVVRNSSWKTYWRLEGKTDA